MHIKHDRLDHAEWSRPETAVVTIAAASTAAAIIFGAVALLDESDDIVHAGPIAISCAVLALVFHVIPWLRLQYYTRAAARLQTREPAAADSRHSELNAAVLSMTHPERVSFLRHLDDDALRKAAAEALSMSPKARKAVDDALEDL